MVANQQAEGSRSSSGGSPPRGIALGDEKDRSVNSDEALYVVEEEVPGSRKDKKSLGNSRCARRHDREGQGCTHVIRVSFPNERSPCMIPNIARTQGYVDGRLAGEGRRGGW